MFTLCRAMPVNAVGEAPLTSRQVWQGLVLKAENPMPFIEAMTACTIVDRGPDWLLRDFTLRGEDMQERVVFEPEHRVTFVRTRSSAMGTILNEIIDDGKDGESALSLRFTFLLAVEGLTLGSAEETAFAERMSRSYFAAVGSTLREIRRRVAAGTIAAA